MLLKLLLLLLYALLLFILARIIETITWYDVGYFTGKLLDPVALSVRKLKLLLDSRGLSHTGVVEKSELIDLIDASGNASEGELSEAESITLEDTTQTNFTCGGHFYEEVEDTKDSVWLVQVIAVDSSQLLPESRWQHLVKKLEKFGIRTGKFDCSLDIRLCERKGWFSSRLVMALPHGQQMKDRVHIQSYQGSTRTQAILDWVNYNLASRITTIHSWNQLKTDWLKIEKYRSSLPVRIVFISRLKLPPMFYSALSVKFTGRVAFGMINLQYSKDADMRKLNSLYRKKSPMYLIILPENTIVYGRENGEYYNYRSLEIVLKMLYPTVNDIFLLMLMLANILSSFQFVVACGSMTRRIFLLLWTMLKYNIALILLWLPILALFQITYLHRVTELTLSGVRIVSASVVATNVRRDWMFYKRNTDLLLLLYFVFVGISSIVVRLCRGEQEEPDDNNNTTWWSFTWDVNLFRTTPSLTQPIPGTLDEEMELLIERMATPTLWLHPIISSDYIKNLPVWQYKRPNSFQSSDSDGDSDVAMVTKEAQSQKDNTIEFQDMQCDKCQSVGEELSHSEMGARAKYVMDGNYKCLCKGITSTAMNEHTTNSSKKNQKRKAVHCQQVAAVVTGMTECTECVICLDCFANDVWICSLPCGHYFHQSCISVWLLNDNHHCPVCRWPTYKVKNCKLHQS